MENDPAILEELKKLEKDLVNAQNNLTQDVQQSVFSTKIDISTYEEQVINPKTESNIEKIFEIEQNNQISLHALYSSKISSPLKLKMDSNLLEYIESNELQTYCEGQPKNLFEPINHLKEILKSQSSESNDSPPPSSKSDIQESQEFKNYPHSCDNSSDDTSASCTDTTHTDVECQTSDTSSLQLPQLPQLDTFNLSLKKRRVPPISLISADIRQVRSRVQRTNAYAAKLELLKQEDTGLHLWIKLNKEKEPTFIKNYEKENEKKLSSPLANVAAVKRYSNPLSISIKNNSQPVLSISKDSLDNSNEILNPPLSVSTNSTKSSTSSSRKSLDGNIQKKNSLRGRPIRFSFQSVTSRFNFGSSSSPTSSTFPTTIEEKNVVNQSNSIIVDEVALNKLCDVLPHADREVLTKYLREAGGKDELIAVGLYMRDFKNDDF
ncbi:2218_t:CDS:2 [Diversispora eburnea]|uniref:2218_t:CDS:1 n=1 Tax=Diversispora eburnea TaxID=1213867 RepID=A0A9N8V4Y8_9GLOM|nr:2218_t:CDS:2 [Diversispora eburnea]